MVTILPKKQNALAESLGSALGQGLHEYASHKLNKLQRREKVRELERHLPQGLAELIVDEHPSVQKAYIDKLEFNPDYQSQRIQQGQQFTPQQTAPVQNMPSDMRQAERPSTENILRSLSGQQHQQQVNPFGGLQQSLAQAPSSQGFNGINQAAQQNNHQPQDQNQGMFRFKTPVDRYQQTFDYNQQKDINKLERPVVEAAVKEYKEALVNDKILDRQLELVEKGKLPDSVLSAGIDRLNKGIFGVSVDLNSILGEDAEEFNKLSAQMANNMRTAGGRVTDLAMNNFLKSIPTLSQSDEGKKRIIENYKIFNDIKKTHYGAVRELIDANNGQVPEGLLLKATDLASQKENSLSDTFNKQFQQPAESTSSQSQSYKNEKSAIDQARKQGLEEFNLVNNENGKKIAYKKTSSGSYMRVS